MRNSYFLGANTSAGFRHCAEDVLNSANRLFIIKGGPGTGKSRLMNEVALAAESRNMTLERYYCSSDPASLDGIYICDLGVCIIDGTAPHERDPRYPGAIDEIVNLSEFWDAGVLQNEKNKIEELCNKKKMLYASVYALMKVSDVIFNDEKKLLYSCADLEKISSAVCRIFKKKGTGGGFSLVERQTESIGMRGNVKLDTYETSADEVYIVSDSRGIDFILFEAIISEAERRCFKVYVSRDPLRNMVINGIYLPELRMAFSSSGSLSEDYKIINTERFIIKEKISENKNKLRSYRRLKNDAKQTVSQLFEEISATHFELEDIYIKAMDFGKKERFSQEFIRKIFEKA